MSRVPRFGSAAACLAMASLGCAPLGDWSACSRDSDAAKALELTIEPRAAHDAAPPVLRLHVGSTAGQSVDPEQIFLIEGEVRSSHLSQLARDDISGALSERIVPAVRWSDGEAEAVIAPKAILTLGGDYALASGSARSSLRLRVVEEDSVPTLALMWPPDGSAVARPVGVWCGQAPLPPIEQQAELAPTDVSAQLLNGVSRAGGGAHCVHLEADAGVPLARDARFLPPPLLVSSDGAPVGRLEPRELAVDAEPVVVTAASCDVDEVRLGPACGLVADDRIYLTTDDAPLLWSFADGADPTKLDQVVATTGSSSFLVHPLPPSTDVTLRINTIDLAGQLETTSVAITTKAAMPHVILNEVMANPIGPEPDQEWIELYNDGLAAAELEGSVVADIGGETVLPAATLPPGGFAIVVGSAFDADSEYDPRPEAGTLIVRVDKLGKAGLNNQGEPLKLLDAAGIVVSRFPAAPKPKAGRSVMRTHPKALDGDAASFVLSPQGATPGAHNQQPAADSH